MGGKNGTVLTTLHTSAGRFTPTKQTQTDLGLIRAWTEVRSRSAQMGTGDSQMPWTNIEKVKGDATILFPHKNW